ncbi:hypothetical protein [Leptolyngbya sp. FACHB-16]|nr:hypothetical protein [Leptolyngbya sp. FACHB-16]MBD1910969.1 hypothetical protein [Leptolyngbya sp. FACHB-8]MBD2158364.1 hypothetical protein [Leptolyngbya sp. FACHB-16]
MNKSGFFMLWMVMGALVGSVFAIAYSVRQATRLPDWYVAQTIESSNSAITSASEAQSDAEVVLSSAQVEQLLQEAIASHVVPSEWQEPAANLSATVKNGRLETGTVVNLAELPLDKLSDRDRLRVEQLLSMVPGLDEQQLFIGLESSPQIRNGRLELEGNTSVRVGRLQLPLDVVAQQFGVSVDDLETQLMELLQQQGISLEQIRIEGDRIYLAPQ